ncbi:Oidioi.mRNA.OKI2018_I69.chr1.g1488.t2.cds [Oikopleura dioica]|uniref:Oidioi.mRNA.OKI2018_I69.chr1.g1488.t2.cds n=1 Tax=Oikopleura dioica TaxID=34765 RepID=A0ABN7SNK8_OIKDI|nr:Oidioi.mRNA.OKI2018_I69.chr1.g1488.t2.cds [Oikopleura dioica]
MSEKSYYSESFLSDDTVVPNSALIEQLRSEMKAESNKVNEKVRLLQLKLSDADMENTDHKKRIAELENTVENQGLKIDQLEKTLEEKVLENEMQTLNVSSEMKIFKPAQKPAAFQENYGLHEKQLEILQEYGCLGHFTENDEFEDYGGNKYTDQTSFALMMKAYKNGLKEFTLKVGALDEDFSVGKSKFNYSDEEIKLPDGGIKLCKHLTITHEGRKIRFKARVQVMDVVAGFKKRIYDWKETDSEGVHEQIILSTDWPHRGEEWYSRYHLTFLE